MTSAAKPSSCFMRSSSSRFGNSCTVNCSTSKSSFYSAFSSEHVTCEALIVFGQVLTSMSTDKHTCNSSYTLAEIDAENINLHYPALIGLAVKKGVDNYSI